MLVKFIVSSDPMFIFYSEDVPEGFSLTYFKDDEIFDYLIKKLSPIDIWNVSIQSDGISCNVVVLFRLIQEVISGLPNFKAYTVDDDMPF